MKKAIKAISIFVTILLAVSTFAFIPNVVFAKETKANGRIVPKSETPVDGRKFQKQMEKIDITPRGVETYRKYKEPSGLRKIVISPTQLQEYAKNDLGSDSVNATFPNANITDYISLTNRNGVKTTKSPNSVPPVSASAALEIENSLVPNPTPPPPDINVQSFSYVKYSYAGLLSNKDILVDAYLDFSHTVNRSPVPVVVSVHDVGTSWDSIAMNWNNKPVCNLLNKFDEFEWSALSRGLCRIAVTNVDIYSSSSTGEVGYGFSTTALLASGINEGSMPFLVLTYVDSESQVESPSKNNLHYNAGAANVSVNPWVGGCSITNVAMDIPVKNGASVQFKMVHNPDSQTGWVTRYENTLTIDSNYVASWTRPDGSILTFLPDITGEWLSPPEFSTYSLSSDPSTGKFAITDKYGSQIIFPAPYPPLAPYPIIPNPIDPPPDPPAEIIYIEDEEEELNVHGCDVEIIEGPIGEPIEIIDPDPIIIDPIMVFDYDAYGRLSDITARDGSMVSLTYNANNKVSAFTDQEGNTTSYTYDGYGRITSITDPLNNTSSITYTTNVGGYTDITITDTKNVDIATISVASNTATVTDVNNNSVYYSYDDRGYCTGITAPESTTYSFTWDGYKNLTSVTNPRGKTTSYTYNNNGMITGITRPDGKTYSQTFDSLNQITSFTNAKFKTTNFTYNVSNNKLASVTNPLSETTTFEYTGDNFTKMKLPYEDCNDVSSTADIQIQYDGNNYIEKVISPEGEEVEFVKDDNGRVIGYTDKNGATWSFQYDDAGRITICTDPYNNDWETVYDDDGKVTALIDPNGNATSYSYDSNGRLTEVEDEAGNKTTYTIANDGSVSSATDPESYTVLYTYDDLGRLTSVQDPMNGIKYYEYDKNGNITKVTDPEGNDVRYEYDDLDRLDKIIDEEDNEVIIVYDDNSNITSITDPLGKTVTMVYDDLDRMVSVTNPYNKTWTREFNKSGRLVKLDGPETNPQEFCYNKDGELISSIDPNGQTQGYEYDAGGRLTKITDPLGNETSISYDLLNRIHRVTDDNGKYVEYTYDKVGNITKIRDRRGNETEYTYDSIYRVTKVKDALGNETEYTYDDNSRVTKVEAPPQINPPTTDFVYDGNGRLTQFTDPLRKSGSFTYDANGLITSKTDRNGDTTNYTYDTLNRLTDIAYSLTDTVEFDYNDASQLISMVDGIGTTEWSYDDVGRITSTDDPWDFTHALTYNDEGMVTQLTAETDQRTYTWNTAGLMTAATRDSLTTNFTYNINSWITEIENPNSVDTDLTYDSLGRMTDIDVVEDATPPVTILELDYTYDENGNITSEKVGTQTWNYTYDALNRLTNVDKPGTVDDIVYIYDARGNRTDIDVGVTDNTDLTFNLADRVTRVDYEDNSYRVFTYDDNGNCTKEEYFSGIFLASKVVVPIDKNKTKEDLLRENEELQAKREHYPFTKAPKELFRSEYLSPYLPETTDEDFYLNSMLSWTNPALASRKRLERWSPYSVNPADEETDFEYDQENRLTKVTLPSDVEVEFFYDGAGRRLKKVVTDDTGDDKLTTTWKYHYIGSQITTVEIDAEEEDDSTTPATVTAVRDETLHIHFGPNAQPVSFEWVRYDYDTSTILDDTYYYHYDVHGSVLKVTDSSADVVISYEYDTLGKITSETNNDGITNPFTFRAFKQVVFDDETGLYYGACYYRPDIGTSLSVSGFDPNPVSLRPINTIAKLNSVSTKITRASVLAMSANAKENEGLTAPDKGETAPEGDRGNSSTDVSDPSLPDNDDDDMWIKPSGGITSAKGAKKSCDCDIVAWRTARGRYNLGWHTICGELVPIGVLYQLAIAVGDTTAQTDIETYRDNLERIRELEKELEENKELTEEEREDIQDEIDDLTAENVIIFGRIEEFASGFAHIGWHNEYHGDMRVFEYALLNDDGTPGQMVYLMPPEGCEIVGRRAKKGEGQAWADAWNKMYKAHTGINFWRNYVGEEIGSGKNPNFQPPVIEGYEVGSIITYSGNGAFGWSTNSKTGAITFLGANGFEDPYDDGTTRVFVTYSKKNAGSTGVDFLNGVKTINPVNIQSWINPGLTSTQILP